VPQSLTDRDIDHSQFVYHDFIPNVVALREGRYGSKPFQCDDETSPGVQRLLPDGLLISMDTAKGGLVMYKVS
jgi:hypothetical protein